MYHLIIAAWPESAAVIMVARETETVDAAEVHRCYAMRPDIIPVVEELLTKYADEGPIEDCCVYGPLIYIDNIAEKIAEAFPQMKVTTERAGV